MCFVKKMSWLSCYKKDTLTTVLPPAVLPPVVTDDLKKSQVLKDSVAEAAAIKSEDYYKTIIADMALKNKNEVKALLQKIDLNDQFAKADILHLKLSHQEELNDKNSEIRALKLKLRHLTNKTELR